jgi:lipopolysaccharide cholinephosphotransferase
MSKQRFLKGEKIDGYYVDENMKKVWLSELEILEKFIAVCKKYNLKYFLAGGTLLGCIRHKGFIPWDDDIDIDMLREDYEKLIEIGPKEFTGKFFFQTVDTDKNYYRPHIQIRNSETTAIVEHEKGLEFNQGIFIDIFPLDAAPNNRVKRFIHSRLTYLINGIGYAAVMINPKVNESIFKIIAHYLAKPIFWFIDYHTYFNWFEKIIAKYNNDKYLDIGEISFDYHDKCIWKREWFNETVELDFEYLKASCPVGYDLVLSKTFGDYMTPVKEPSYHGNIIFDTEKSYRAYIVSSERKNQ